MFTLKIFDLFYFDRKRFLYLNNTLFQSKIKFGLVDVEIPRGRWQSNFHILHLSADEDLAAKSASMCETICKIQQVFLFLA